MSFAFDLLEHAALNGALPRATGRCLAGPEFFYPLGGGITTGEAPLGVRWSCAHCGRFGPPQYCKARHLSHLSMLAEVRFHDPDGAGADYMLWFAGGAEIVDLAHEALLASVVGGI